MLNLQVSPCGRFMVLSGLHIDHRLFETVERWATQRGLQVQDAIQLALCGLTEDELAEKAKAPAA